MTSLIIAGLQKTSLIDWPGMICSTIFLARCNLRCHFCHNPELVLPDKIESLEPLSEQELLEQISRHSKYIDGVCITGGEPLLDQDIMRLIRKIKDKGLKVKIDTNGTRPELLGQLIGEGLVDYVAMDIKGPKSKYAEIVGVGVDLDKIQESINILMQSDLDYEFRTTIVKGLHDKDDVMNIAQWITGARAYYLQQFTQSGKMLNPGYLEKKSYMPEELKKMLETVAGNFEKIGVRGI